MQHAPGAPQVESLRGLYLYQIFYSEATRRTLDPGFLPLDNLDNARPDWFEYWVIRRFLQATVLDEQGLYGFFSPKFAQKTGLSAQAVRQFVDNQRRKGVDLYLFSPHWEAASYFRNVFEHGDRFHPGLLAASQAFFESAGWRVDLGTLVMSTQTCVYCNYFVATPRFWRRWLEVGEFLFRMGEDQGHPLSRLLTAATTYDDDRGTINQLKVFVVERLASFLVCVENWTAAAYDFSALSSPGWPEHQRPDFLALDALKISYSQTGNERFVDEYERRRRLL